MTRADCYRWIEENGYPKPPRSACIFCPYHNNDYWRYLKTEWEEEWEEACEFDDLIRKGVNRKSASMSAEELYLHSDLVPLREVDLSTDVDRGQLTFLDECDSVCYL